MAPFLMISDQATAPLNYFLHAHGPAARPSMILGWVFGAISILVCIIVAALLIGALLHKRAPLDDNIIGHEHEGLRWIYIGSAVSTVVLFFMAIYALEVLNESAAPPQISGLTITVTGYDWWWKVKYSDFETANEIHIPVGVPVLIDLNSADVIHAFWVPRLAGKTQMIPGMTNRQWLQADEPGVYRGQCTQFCGVQHAHMAFEVIAQSKADFATWEAAQRQPAATSESSGQQIFMKQCAGCHAVRGTPAAGGHAPDLTHLDSRTSIAAGMMINSLDRVMEWVAHAQQIKPGCGMPDFTLSAGDADALSNYLATLK